MNVRSMMATAIALLVIFIMSCGHGSSLPTSPDSAKNLPSPQAVAARSDAGRYLLAYYEVHVSGNHVEMVPVRDLATHFNVLKFLEQGPCTNCVTVKGVVTTSQGTKEFDVEIRTAFTQLNFTGFDVRGIPIFNASDLFPVAGLGFSNRSMGDGELVNADGYTTLYNSNTAGSGPGGLQGYFKGKFASKTIPNSKLNGFKRHVSAGATNTRNALFAGDKITVTYELDMPNNGFVFGYAVDASWAPPTIKPVTDPIADFPSSANCPEPWKIEVAEVPISAGITEFGGTETLAIDVYDWQGKDSHLAPEVECPGLFDGTKAAVFMQNFTDHSRWEAVISNDKLPAIGSYRCLIKVADKDSLTEPLWLDLTAYRIISVNVRESGWARAWGGTDLDAALAIAEGSDGSIYSFGEFKGTVDLDPGPGTDIRTSADTDCVVSKFNAKGEIQWIQTYGGAGTDEISNAVLAGTNLYILGPYQQTVDFDPSSGVDNHTSVGDFDCYLMCLDTNGNFQWARTWGGAGTEIPYKVSASQSGMLLVGGYFSDTVDFDPGSSVNNFSTSGLTDSDAFISKFDTSGNYSWTQVWGETTGSQEVTGIATDSSDNIYCSGDFAGTVDFNPGASTDNHTSAGAADAYLSKFNSAGDFQWAKTWGGINGDLGHDVLIDSAGNPWVGGYFDMTVDFDPGPATKDVTTNGGLDGYFSVFDSSGNFQRVTTFGGSGEDAVWRMVLDSSDNVVVTGVFSTTVDFDPGAGTVNRTSNGSDDAYVAKYTAAGALVWVATWGGTLGDFGYGIFMNKTTGNICSSGYVEDIVDLDPGSGVANYTSAGNYDAYIMKLLPGGTW